MIYLSVLKMVVTINKSLVVTHYIWRKAIIDIAKNCSDIDAIMLFGSALEERCKERSDIDIVIFSKKTVNALSSKKSFDEFKRQLYFRDLSQEYDFLYFKSIDEIYQKIDKAPIFKELAEKGKIIYKRQVA